MSDHDELESLVAAWVLGAVEQDSAERVRAHIAGCQECRDVVERLTPVTGALALDVDEVAPPPGLRDRILDSARQRAANDRGQEGDDAGRIVPLLRRQPRAPRRAWRIPATGVAAIVAIALLAGLLAGDAIGRGNAPPAQAQVARFTLAGHDAMQGVTASVIDLKSDGIALVTFANVPAPPAGKVYELWLITPAGKADPAAVFIPDPTGSKVVVVGRSLDGYRLMAVTVEAGPTGVDSPTQQPQIYGNVA